MTPLQSFIRRMSILLLMTIFNPVSMLAGCYIPFSDLGLDDGTPCSLPLQNEKLAISFKNGKGKYNARKKIMALSKGTSITIKAKDGEKITGILLKTTNKKKNKKNIQFFSSDTGKCQRGLWTGSANAVTIKCLQDCDISGIRAAFSSDLPEAYAVKTFYFHDTGYDDTGYDARPKLILYYDTNKSLMEENYGHGGWDEFFVMGDNSPYFYSIDGNSFYPPWYGDKHIDRFDFNPSFADFRPKRTSHWFDGFNSNITNMQYLNTSETVDMSYMFANFNYHLMSALGSYYYIFYGPVNNFDGYMYYHYNTYNYDQDIYLTPDDIFYSSIFEDLDFSKVQNVSHMFSGCGMRRFVLSSGNVSSINNTSDMFEDSNVELVTLTSDYIKVSNDFFDGLGSAEKPCVIDAPDNYDFGVDTSGETFLWKGGLFRGFQQQGYVLCKKQKHESVDMYYYESFNYIMEFYYDKKRYVRESKSYETPALLWDEDWDENWKYYKNSLEIESFSLNEGYEAPLWLTYASNDWYKASREKWDYYEGYYDYSISTSIRFDKSFADCRPKSTYRWFDFVFYNKKIEGLEYLNTSETTNMERMFYGLIDVDSLDLSHLDLSKVTNSKNMLSCSYSLKNLSINSTWTDLDPSACAGIGYNQPCVIHAPAGFNFETDTSNDCFAWKSGRFIMPGVQNQSEAYAVLNESILSFYFDKNKNERVGNKIAISQGSYVEDMDFDGQWRLYPAEMYWNRYNYNYSDVVFEPSFINNQPGSTIGWFYRRSTLKSVQGMENLRSTDMSSMFSMCENLSAIDLSGCDMSMTKDTKEWFYGCTKLTDIILPNTCAIIGAGAFENCTNLPSIIIPESVTTIGDSAFNGCTNLTTVTVMSSIPLPITESTFSNRRNATLIVPTGARDAYLTADYWKEFKEIKEIRESPNIIFADAKVKAICVGNWDTSGDGELSESEAAKVTSLGNAFQKTQISSFNELQYFTGLTEISEGAFSNSTVKAITLPKNIISLKKNAFLSCKSLTSLHLPANVKEIEQNVLSGCTIMTSITVDDDNQNFCDIDGVLFSKDKTLLIQFPAAKSTAYTVPEGTVTIGRDAFYISKLESVGLPSSLSELGYDAFGWCRQLIELAIPEGVTVIGDYVLDGCTSLTSLYIPASATTIGEHVCNGCNTIKDVWSNSQNPFAINSNNFTSNTYANATLHIPYGLKVVYGQTNGWKNFNLSEDDIGIITLPSADLAINLGHNCDLTVGLSNNKEIEGMQFDLILPEGISIATDENGDFIVGTTDRSEQLYTQCEKQSDGSYRIILMSTKRATIAPGEGGIIKIRLTCNQDANPGTYDLYFTSVSLSRKEGPVSVNERKENLSAMLTINNVSILKGDANGDYEVNLTDVLVIVDYILNRPNKIFIFDNADLDNNNNVNINDALNVVNMILDTTASFLPRAARMSAYELLRMDSGNMGCIIHTTAGISNITAMQMDVTLPIDCRLRSASLIGKASGTHQVMMRQLEDKKYRIVVFSSMKELLDTDAAILNLDIEGRGGMVCAENIQCFDEQNMPILSSDINAVATGINEVHANSNDDTPIYNISGQRVTKRQKGINIVNGHKVVVR